MGVGESRPHLEVFKRIFLVLCSGMISGVGQETICVTWDLNLRLVKVQEKHPNFKSSVPYKIFRVENKTTGDKTVLGATSLISHKFCLALLPIIITDFTLSSSK